MPAPSAREAQAALTILVSELRRPFERDRLELGSDGAPMARATVVPELPRSAHRETPLVPPAPFVEPIRRAAEPRAAASTAADSVAFGRRPVPPNAAMTGPARPGTPGAGAVKLAGAELDRLADKVGRMIARRVAVERERRGR
jgi:hypothetical protein